MTERPLIVDASALVASVNRRDPQHRRVRATLEAVTAPIVTSQIVLAEVDYLILTRDGVDTELAFLDDVVDRVYRAEGLTPDELRQARDVVARYRDLQVGLADASIVTLCRRFRTRQVLTLDERCFRAMTPLDGGHFEVLPADS